MTAPSRLAGDVISKVITAGQPALLVTEYMPGDPGAQLINTATTGTLYAGTSSSVQPSNGVPIPAGSSVQWTEPGQLWIAPGPDVTDPVTLVVTSRISSWAPSPEVVATAVATQLIDAGIPNVGLQETLYNADPAGGSTLTLDTSRYASVQLYAYAGAGQMTPVSMIIAWYTTDGTELQTVYWDTYGPGDSPTSANATLAVRGPTMKITTPAGNVLTGLTIIGSNRPADAALDGRVNANSLMNFQLNAQALVAGTTYQVPQTNNADLAGSVFASFAVSGAARGRWFLDTWLNTALLSADVADTAEGVTNGTTIKIYKMMALPANAKHIRFNCTTSGTAGVYATFYPANL